jgi:dephospho-CoA kinase
MIKIGLTGVVGSGKSTVAALLKKRGLDVIDLDALARDSLNRKETQDDIKRVFGDEYVVGDRVDVEKLRVTAFGNRGDLRKLESIIHPRVHDEMVRRVEELERGGARAVVFDHPLLFETDFWKKVDKIVVVTARLDLIRARLKKRGMDADDMARRLSFQRPLREKEVRADAVINNNGAEDLLEKRVDSLLEKITKWEVPQHASK